MARKQFFYDTTTVVPPRPDFIASTRALLPVNKGASGSGTLTLIPRPTELQSTAGDLHIACVYADAGAGNVSHPTGWVEILAEGNIRIATLIDDGVQAVNWSWNWQNGGSSRGGVCLSFRNAAVGDTASAALTETVPDVTTTAFNTTLAAFGGGGQILNDNVYFPQAPLVEEIQHVCGAKNAYNLPHACVASLEEGLPITTITGREHANGWSTTESQFAVLVERA